MASHYFQILPLYMYLYANILYCCHDLVSHCTWWSSISVFLLAPAEQMAVGETTACTETSDSKWLAITDFSFRINWFQVHTHTHIHTHTQSCENLMWRMHDSSVSLYIQDMSMPGWIWSFPARCNQTTSKSRYGMTSCSSNCQMEGLLHLVVVILRQESQIGQSMLLEEIHHGLFKFEIWH